MTRRPPRLAERILGRMLNPGPETDATLGDLAEDYNRHASRLVADLWYWRQTLSITLHRATMRGDTTALTRPDGRQTITDALIQDLHFAVGAWGRQPALAGLMIAALAIGIGGTTAIFSVVRAVLLRPLPYRDPSSLVLIWSESREAPGARGAFSSPDLVALREHTRLFEDVAAVNSFGASLTDGEHPEQIQLGVITANFLSLLGVEPALGRNFVAGDDTPMDTRDPRNASVVILGHELWTRRYGADPGILGRSILIGGTPMTVVGVLPRSFRLHLPAGSGMSTSLAAWTPLRIDYVNGPRASAYLKVVGRLRPGVSSARAQHELDDMAARFRTEFPPHEAAGLTLRAVSMHQDVVSHISPILAVLTATVGVLLVIACANVANLLLVRMAAREREIAIRRALGGSRGRLVRQLLVESGVIAVAAAIVGIAVAWGGIQILLALQPAEIPRLEEAAIDGTVLGFTLAIATASAVLFGLAPAVLSSGTDATLALRARSAGPTGRSSRLRNGLVVAEIALSLVLLIGAGLMLRTVASLQRAPLGFDPAATLTFRITLPFTAYRGALRWGEFFRELEQRLAQTPGVRAVGSGSGVPAGGQMSVDAFGLESGRETRPWGSRSALYRTVSPGYFAALALPVRLGRGFSTADGIGTPPVVVVDEALARSTWPGQQAVGEHLEILVERFDRGYRLERITAEVIGVAATVPNGRPDGSATGTIYLPHAQHPLWSMTVAVRTAGSPPAFLGQIRETVRAMDPALPVYEVRTLDEVVAATMATTRLVLLLIALFATTALVLAVMGLYGVIAFAVRQRTTELGVRLALGASPERIARGVVRDGFRLAGAGVGLGLLVAPWLARGLTDLLVDVTPGDWITRSACAILVVALVVIASAVPARRAARLNPAEALRSSSMKY